MLAGADIRRILILQIGPIGDTLFTMPALKALRGRFPAATIAVLASPGAGDVLRGTPYLDILRVCRSGLDLIRAMAEFRQLGFDLAIGLSTRGSWLASFCRAPYKAGFPSPFLSLSEPGPLKEIPSTHIVEYCLDVARLVGAAVPEGEHALEIWLSPGDREGAEAFMAAHHLRAPLVAMHPSGHYFRFKRWPVERYAQLAEALAVEGCQTVVVGGPEDTELGMKVARLARSAPALAVGRLRLKETAALIGRCQLFIGNDSAPLHMAAAVGTPAIGLFGPTSPSQFSPCGPGHSVIYKSLPCSPCFRFLGGPLQYWPRCSRARCMEAIGVDEVLMVALHRLGLAAGTPGLEEGRG